MKITSLETIPLSKGVEVHAGPIQWLWVRIHTDSGLVGLGETYPHPEAEKAVDRQPLRPGCRGANPRRTNGQWGRCSRRYRSAAGRAPKCEPSARWISRSGIWPAKRRGYRSISCWAERRAL